MIKILSSLFITINLIEMDTRKWSVGYCVEGLYASAAICWEIGENIEIFNKREIVDTQRFGQNMGIAIK